MIYVSKVPEPQPQRVPTPASCSLSPGLTQAWPRPMVPLQHRQRDQYVQGKGGHSECDLFVKKKSMLISISLNERMR